MTAPIGSGAEFFRREYGPAAERVPQGTASVPR